MQLIACAERKPLRRVAVRLNSADYCLRHTCQVFNLGAASSGRPLRLPLSISVNSSTRIPPAAVHSIHVRSGNAIELTGQSHHLAQFMRVHFCSVHWATMVIGVGALTFSSTLKVKSVPTASALEKR
jgi:hypothetical protein